MNIQKMCMKEFDIPFKDVLDGEGFDFEGTSYVLDGDMGFDCGWGYTETCSPDPDAMVTVERSAIDFEVSAAPLFNFADKGCWVINPDDQSWSVNVGPEIIVRLKEVDLLRVIGKVEYATIEIHCTMSNVCEACRRIVGFLSVGLR